MDKVKLRWDIQLKSFVTETVRTRILSFSLTQKFLVNESLTFIGIFRKISYMENCHQKYVLPFNRQINCKFLPSFSTFNSVNFPIYFFNIFEISWTKFYFFIWNFSHKYGKKLVRNPRTKIHPRKFTEASQFKKAGTIGKNIFLKIHQKFH